MRVFGHWTSSSRKAARRRSGRNHRSWRSPADRTSYFRVDGLLAVPDVNDGEPSRRFVEPVDKLIEVRARIVSSAPSERLRESAFAQEHPDAELIRFCVLQVLPDALCQAARGVVAALLAAGNLIESKDSAVAVNEADDSPSLKIYPPRSVCKLPFFHDEHQDDERDCRVYFRSRPACLMLAACEPSSARNLPRNISVGDNLSRPLSHADPSRER